MKILYTHRHILLSHGFTFVETLAVVSIVLTLLGLASVNLISFQRSANITEAVDTLVADIRNQQTKAMSGETTQGASTGGYGVYFDTNRYILFSGTTYSAAATTNSVIPLKSPIYADSILFPNQSLVFLARSGEVSGFVNGSNSIILKEQNGTKSRKISINQYGVITTIQ